MKLSHAEFIKKAIVSLRKDGYKGIHAVYSGFNAAFKEYFPGDDVKIITLRLKAEGIISITPAKRGVMLYLAEDIENNTGKKILEKMGL
ncbi:MAG: hypothetical protein EPN88_13950 [Bacteroidetes bacterium]|nr:MAG: hypothetical protein EPN88_13950 [Bacteroidota bacterium]